MKDSEIDPRWLLYGGGLLLAGYTLYKTQKAIGSVGSGVSSAVGSVTHAVGSAWDSATGAVDSAVEWLGFNKPAGPIAEGTPYLVSTKANNGNPSALDIYSGNIFTSPVPSTSGLILTGGDGSFATMQTPF